MARPRISEITYYEITRLLGPNKWRCHVTTADGDTHSSEGYTKEVAKEAELIATMAERLKELS